MGSPFKESMDEVHGGSPWTSSQRNVPIAQKWCSSKSKNQKQKNCSRLPPGVGFLLKIEAYYNSTLSVIHSYKSDHPSILINLDNCLCSHLSKTKKTRLGYQELITSQNNFRQSMKTQQWPTFAVTVGALLSWILDWSCDMETPDFRCAVWSGVTSSSGLSLPSESLSSP